jgi:vacuolar-type H+-ATPase subunit H
MIEKLAPIAEKTQGTFSTTLSLTTQLDNELMPVYNTMNGGGKLITSTITVANVNTLDKLADILKMPDLSRIKSGPINLSYEFSDGRLWVKPFDMKYQDINANLGGSTGFDQTIDYDMKLTIPRAKFGGQANAILDNLISQANNLGTNFSVGEKIDVNVKIAGTISNPQIKTGLSGSSGNMMEDLKKKAQEELEKQKQKLEEEARKELEKKKAEAKAEADKILADAKKKADKILSDAQAQADTWNKAAEDAAEKAKKEAEKQAAKIVEDAKKNGTLAEMAAKAATKELIEEANKNADKIVSEARSKSEQLLKEAQKQADKINADARRQADDLLEGK